VDKIFFFVVFKRTKTDKIPSCISLENPLFLIKSGRYIFFRGAFYGANRLTPILADHLILKNRRDFQ